MLQPLLALLALLAFWQGEYMVVEAVVVWELPSLALLEAVVASDPSVGDPRPWVHQQHRLGSSSTEVWQPLALLEWQPTLSHDAVAAPRLR